MAALKTRRLLDYREEVVQASGQYFRLWDVGTTTTLGMMDSTGQSQGPVTGRRFPAWLVPPEDASLCCLAGSLPAGPPSPQWGYPLGSWHLQG